MGLLAEAWATPGLEWLIAGALIGGLVRGFAGFGAALIYLPIAGHVLPPLEALVTMTIMDTAGPLVNIPRAWRDAHRRDVARLGIGFLLAAPVGLVILAISRPEVFRYAVSLGALSLLLLLVSGYRYRGRIRRPMVYGIGAAGGFLGGVAGLSGPPVILFYMARDLEPAVIRANTLLYLMISSISISLFILTSGQVTMPIVVLGVLLMVPSVLANALGAAIFRPEAAVLYRSVAYLIIAVSALSGLPFLD